MNNSTIIYDISKHNNNLILWNYINDINQQT